MKSIYKLAQTYNVGDFVHFRGYGNSMQINELQRSKVLEVDQQNKKLIVMDRSQRPLSIPMRIVENHEPSGGGNLSPGATIRFKNQNGQQMEGQIVSVNGDQVTVSYLTQTVINTNDIIQ